PEEHFRIPVTIELPHAEGDGMVVCQSGASGRTVLDFEAMPASTPFPLHVNELPRRCGVYSTEHVRALKAAREAEAAQVQKGNDSFHWQIKGQVCDPHDLVRPNAGRDLREPPGVGGCPKGMTPIRGRRACVDRWEAHVVEVLEDGTEHTWSPYFNPGAL